ncbi:MAG: PilZ domain-containing protein [Lachnospiraceae bacterium]|nr:PilZ domain-containing protein [Lachnospiraceae bacterium]
MNEKRKDKRIPVNIALSVSDLYTDNSFDVADISSPIEVTDISARGMGFICEAVLPIGSCFISNIELSRDLPQIITDLRIIRSQALPGGRYQYGCEFTSISPRVSRMLDDYEARMNHNAANE